MKDGSLITETSLASTELLEILHRLGNGASIQPDFDATRGTAVNGNIEEDRLGNIGILLSEQTLEHASNHLKLALRLSGSELRGEGGGRGKGDRRCKKG